jgi:hypothetical protein
MLWKPATPVYPKLIKEAPEGLTKEEADEMRRKGRDLLPICKLGIKLLINFIPILIDSSQKKPLFLLMIAQVCLKSGWPSYLFCLFTSFVFLTFEAVYEMTYRNLNPVTHLPFKPNLVL